MGLFSSAWRVCFFITLCQCRQNAGHILQTLTPPDSEVCPTSAGLFAWLAGVVRRYLPVAAAAVAVELAQHSSPRCTASWILALVGSILRCSDSQRTYILPVLIIFIENKKKLIFKNCTCQAARTYRTTDDTQITYSQQL